MLAVGAVFAYSAIKGHSVSSATREFITGGDLSSLPNAAPINTTPDVAGPAVTSDSLQVSTTTGNPAANKSVGKMMAAQYGWATGNEWESLDALWTRESGWRNTADNPDSHAYGIPQALPASKLPHAGQPTSLGGSSSAVSQIAWGLSYIKSRYGSPSAAWAHETANGWY